MTTATFTESSTAGLVPSIRGSEQSAQRLPAALPIAALVSVALVVFAGGYGYHRDELYFLVAAHHLAWAYPDQGVLTPLIARLMTSPRAR